MSENSQIKGFISNLIASATWEGVKGLFGWPLLTSLLATLWAIIRNRSVDWWGILALFIVTCLVFWFARKRPAQSPVAVSAPEPQKRPSKLVIHSANYRAWEKGGETRDVATFLRKIITGDSLVFGPIENDKFVVDGENFVPEDPYRYKPKRLEVTYSYEEIVNKTVVRPEHGRLVLPEDTELLESFKCKIRLEEIIREDFEHIRERVSLVKQTVEFSFHLGVDPYVDVVMEVSNCSVFQIVTFGEVRGQTMYGTSQLPDVAQVFDSSGPPGATILTLKRGESGVLRIRQFISENRADLMVAESFKEIPLDFGLVYVKFTAIFHDMIIGDFDLFGPHATIAEAKRV